MSLISCLECGKEISSSARKCPFCGYKMKKQVSRKKIQVSLIVLVALVIIASAFYIFVYQPQHIPEVAMSYAYQGRYIEADKLYGKLGENEDSTNVREQFFYESRILLAAQLVREKLVFPETISLQEAIVLKGEDGEEPNILLHYLAQSRGGSMVDGFSMVRWEDNAYSAGRLLSDLEVASSQPWYISDEDAYDFWTEQLAKAKILEEISEKESIGTFDLSRVNKALKSTNGKQSEIIQR